MPLLPLQDAALHAKRVEFAAHYEVLAEVNKNVEGSSARKNVGHSLKAMRVYPPRSMVVLPSCPADMTLYFTVSRVCTCTITAVLCLFYFDVLLGDRVASSMYSRTGTQIDLKRICCNKNQE